MQMVRLNIIKRHNPAGSKPAENVDLDEKIRRIREANKKREQRFQEIEEDKMLASDPALMKKESYKNNTNKSGTKELLKGNVHTDVKSNNQKGVQPDTIRKMAKGRGQRLMEMKKHPLKAKHFESMRESLEEYFPEKVTLMNNCRSSIRERIKTKNKDCAATVPEVGNENTRGSEVSKANDKLDCIPEGEQNEIPENEILSDDIRDETITAENPETQQNSTKTDLVLDNVEEEETVTEIKEASTSNKQLGKEPTKQKTNKPKITVSLKKTASNSSFDESMAMLSPLDLPQNWGDLDFSDDELPPVSIWKNS